MKTKSVNLKLVGDIEEKEGKKFCNNLSVEDDIPEDGIKIKVLEPTHLYKLCEDRDMTMFTLKEKKKIFLRYNGMWLYSFDEHRL